MKQYDTLIIGGGAAGFFTAINLAESRPDFKIAILERGNDVLQKVRISGGGRCNVAHACFEPSQLVKFYPRGEKELRGPFHQFSSADTVTWFENRGIKIKTEPDGRMFPVSNDSKTIVVCFQDSARKLGVEVLTGQSVQSVLKSVAGWNVNTANEGFSCRALVAATGSNPKIWQMMAQLGHTIIAPVPSLFTFNIKDERIAELPGISSFATIKIKGTKLEASGPLLITHWGMSGPAVLKLSAWGARVFAEMNYEFTIQVNWLPEMNQASAEEWLKSLKSHHPKKVIAGKSPDDAGHFPNRLWDKLVAAAGIQSEKRWADASKSDIQNLASQLANCEFKVDGKSTYKDEFVTAGGVDLREIDFKTMQSKLRDNLYFAGEILNIDALTGGFNFQNAWTGGFLVANAIKNTLPLASF